MTQPIGPTSAQPPARTLSRNSAGEGAGAAPTAAAPAAATPPAEAQARVPAAKPGAAPAEVDTGAVAIPGRAGSPGLVDGYREILRNPRNVNGVRDAAGDEAPETAATVPDPAALQRAVQAMPADRRAQYDQVLAATRTDPAAQDALGVLAIQGRLVGGPADQGGQDLLANLARFAGQPVQPPIDRAAALGDMIQEIADPAAINQGAANTCALAVGQMYLAQADPAEYVRLQAGLMSPEGRVTTRDGSVMRREPGTERPRTLQTLDGPQEDQRADTSRIFQGAAMEMANTDAMDYDPITDRTTDRASGVSDTNAPSGAPAYLMQALTGRNAERVRPGREGHPSAEQAMTRLEAAAAQRPQQVNLTMGHGDAAFTHAVLVQRVDADHVYYRNPWGTEERMSRAEFQGRVRNMFIQDAQATRYA